VTDGVSQVASGGDERRRSVLVIAPTPFFADRGCHVRIYEEVQLLKDLGYHVEVCTYHLGRDMPGVLTRRTPNIPWYQKLGPGPSYHKPYLDLLLLWACAKAIREIRPCLIHAHLHEGALIGKFLGKLFGIPCVADLQGSLVKELADYSFAGAHRRGYGILAAVEGWIDRSADQIIVSSDLLQEDVVSRFRVPRDRVTVVKDGVGRGLLKKTDPCGRHKLGIPENHEVVVFMGVLTQLQGIDILMKAIPIVLNERADATFVVIGFPGEDQYADRLTRQGYGDRAVFTGRIDYLEVSQALGLADIAVSPKISETEGNGKLSNYMACGLPTIVFESPVNREILGDDGIYVPTRTPEAFARAILEALAGGEEVRKRGDRLRTRAIESNSWDANREVLESVYRKAMQS
jgi:glycosyltransferase involved in cell wall biosynthesis